MKKIPLYICSLVLAFTSLLSCNLDTSPTNMVDSDVVFGTGEKAEVAFNGAWEYLFETYYTYANPGYTAILRTSDAMGSDVAMLSGKYGYLAPYQFSELSDKTQYRTKSVWSLLYRTINNCNAIINSPDVAGDTRMSRAKGQTYALRAFCYLNLVQFYQFNYQKDKLAKAVPIYTEATSYESKDGKPRATVEAVYTLIETDLTKALELLKDYDRKADKFRPNTQVVNGLLARMYLNMGLYDKAAKAANVARQQSTLMSQETFLAGFNDLTNNEWIWGHPQTPTQSVASYTFQYLDQVSGHSYYKSVRPDPNFMNLHADGDVRKKTFFWDTEPARLGICGSSKFRFRADLTGDIVLMRAAEMLLIEAESLVEINRVGEGVVLLNQLLIARNAPVFDETGKTKQDVIQAILLERRKELWGEGFSLSDILRRQQSVVRKTYKAVTGQTQVEVLIGVLTKIDVKGDHWALTFSDKEKTPFVANSPYYLFAISEIEEQSNPNLYK